MQSAWIAFRMYQKGKADFADCLLGTTNRFGGCSETVTFNQAASKLEDFQLLEPALFVNTSAAIADVSLKRDRRDWREKRDRRDTKFKVLGSKFQKPRTSNVLNLNLEPYPCTFDTSRSQ